MNVPIGLVGLGIMGSAIAASLMRSGHPVIGYDVQSTRRRELRRAGGSVARTCREVGETARVVICSLPSADALRETAAELARSGRPPQVVIETSTLPIDVKARARRTLRARGSALLDCPVSGTGAQARTGDIVFYASGSRTAYRRVSPVLGACAHAHYFVGPFGAGSKMKFVANLLVAVHNVAAAEALVLAMKAGLDPGMALELASAGAGSSRILQLRGPMMVAGEYARATMTLGNWQKDMTIIAEFARRLGCATPLFSATAPIYDAAIAMGRSSEDTAAVCAVIEQRSHYRRTPRARTATRRQP